MSDIVISYARKDEKWRKMLARCLQDGNGLDVWSDERIQPGEEFSDAINREIRKTRVVIVIWTPESVTSSWVCAEALRARDLGKLIPVRMGTDDVGSNFEVPLPFNGMQTLDLTSWKGECDFATVNQLIDYIKRVVDRIIIEDPSGEESSPQADAEKPNLLNALANLVSRHLCRSSVYVSYAWKEEEQNRLVDKLEQACAARGIKLRRDKNQIGYGNSIRQFMDQLGAGRHVVLVLSDAYFKSEYCMYELRQIYEHGDLRKRIHPVVLSGTRFHKSPDRLPYFEYWEKEIADLQAKLAKLSDPKNTLKVREELDRYAEFRRLLDKWLSDLADINTKTEDVHVATDFAALLDRIVPAWEPGCVIKMIILTIAVWVVCNLLSTPSCDPVTDLARPELAERLKEAEGYLANGQAEEAIAKYKEVQKLACSLTRKRVADVLNGSAERLGAKGDFEAAARAYQAAFKEVVSPSDDLVHRTKGDFKAAARVYHEALKEVSRSPTPIDRLSRIMVNDKLVVPGAPNKVLPRGSISGVLESESSDSRTIVAIVDSGGSSQSFEVKSSGGNWRINPVYFRPPAKAIAEAHVQIAVKRETADPKTQSSAIFQFDVEVAPPRLRTHELCRRKPDCPETIMLGTVENLLDQEEKLIIKVGRSTPGVTGEEIYCLFADVTGTNWRSKRIPHTEQGSERVRLQEAGLAPISSTSADCSEPIESIALMPGG
jgi:tetratricopeptide (TPR) repeat protein